MKKETAVFAGGCFWCTEAVFEGLKGVTDVMSGYAGGSMDAPSYEQVSMGTTGHAEVVKVEFDPSVISFRDLLEVFFTTHDPTTINSQGADVGTQYRSMIMYTTEDQRRAVEEYINELTAQKLYDAPIVTEVKELGKFFPAEGYHQDYYQKNSDAPYCQLVINPKLAKLRQKHAKLLK